MQNVFTHQKMPKSLGDNLSNNDSDTVSQTLKDQKVNLQKWKLSILPWHKRWLPRDESHLGLISTGETHRAKDSNNSFSWITSLWEYMLFSFAFWKQTFNDTSGITVLFRVTSWCPKVCFPVFSVIKQRQGGFWGRKKAHVISTYKDWSLPMFLDTFSIDVKSRFPSWQLI